MFELDTYRNFAAFVIIVGGLIFLHELGHFLAARWRGVHIKEFGIGFPPRLFGTALDKNGSRRWFFGRPPADLDPNSVIYSINWLPIGGFVRPAGEDDPTVPDGLANSSKLTRLIVLAAGPAMNLLVGVIVFTVAFATGYPQYTNRVRIAGVVREAPAYAAGIQPGDIVISANGEAVDFESGRLSQIIQEHLGRPVEIVLERDGQPLSLTVTPRTVWPEGQGPTGINLDREWSIATQPLPSAIVSGFSEVAFQIRQFALLPANIIAGTIKASDVRPISIVGMAQINDLVVDTAIQVQSWFPILQFTGAITIALAITNLLPLPALDGGRILFVLVEAVRGRRVDPLREGYVHVMGMLALLALTAVLVINDILNPVFAR